MKNLIFTTLALMWACVFLTLWTSTGTLVSAAGLLTFMIALVSTSFGVAVLTEHKT